jgi:formate-dependent nitrite reductase cytochrome c552 subunit
LYHVFYSDGNAKRISWVIQTKDSIVEQNREHADIYKDKVTSLQSKYIALHVGLFWGIGIFIIKNEDIVKIKLDEKIMYDHFTSNSKIEDEFIEKRMQFIMQLIEQRKLKMEFEMIDSDKNLARKSITAKELKTKNG